MENTGTPPTADDVARSLLNSYDYFVQDTVSGANNNEPLTPPETQDESLDSPDALKDNELDDGAILDGLLKKFDGNNHPALSQSSISTTPSNTEQGSIPHRNLAPQTASGELDESPQETSINPPNTRKRINKIRERQKAGSNGAKQTHNQEPSADDTITEDEDRNRKDLLYFFLTKMNCAINNAAGKTTASDPYPEANLLFDEPDEGVLIEARIIVMSRRISILAGMITHMKSDLDSYMKHFDILTPELMSVGESLKEIRNLGKYVNSLTEAKDSGESQVRSLTEVVNQLSIINAISGYD